MRSGKLLLNPLSKDGKQNLCARIFFFSFLLPIDTLDIFIVKLLT